MASCVFTNFSSDAWRKGPQMTDEDIKRVTLRIPKQLHDALFEASFKSRKLGEVKSINTIGIEALEMWLKAQEPKGQGRGK